MQCPKKLVPRNACELVLTPLAFWTRDVGFHECSFLLLQRVSQEDALRRGMQPYIRGPFDARVCT
jgi:hypothetical protein